jgi:type VI protein secretion system component Hcp
LLERAKVCSSASHQRCISRQSFPSAWANSFPVSGSRSSAPRFRLIVRMESATATLLEAADDREVGLVSWTFIILPKQPFGNPSLFVSTKLTSCLISEVDVLITIFCDFCHFSAKNWRFSQKPML